MAKPRRLNKILTRQEFKAVTAAVVGISSESDQHEDAMSRVITTTAALRLSVIDAVRNEHIHKRCGVDTDTLLSKIDGLTGPETIILLAACQKYWNSRCTINDIDYTQFMIQSDKPTKRPS